MSYKNTTSSSKRQVSPRRQRSPRRSARPSMPLEPVPEECIESKSFEISAPLSPNRWSSIVKRQISKTEKQAPTTTSTSVADATTAKTIELSTQSSSLEGKAPHCPLGVESSQHQSLLRMTLPMTRRNSLELKKPRRQPSVDNLGPLLLDDAIAAAEAEAEDLSQLETSDT